MKRTISVLGPSVLALGILGACAPSEAPVELRDARSAYVRAQNGPAAQTNRAGLMEARQALDAAEHEYVEHPGSDDVKTLSYVAERKSEIAEADGRTALAQSQQAAIENRGLQMQAQKAQNQAVRSERRAKIALERLGLSAKEVPQGTVITLPCAETFATNKAVILPDAKQRLTEVARGVKSVMEENPADKERKITIIGYTDDRGTDAHNMDLSKKRAEAVRDFFVKQGIDKSMLETDGRGKAEPVADNTTEDGRSQNRRVEITISPGASERGSSPSPQK
jgi:outer membrane protein OmpA-like peptidoglycan-associated protein